MAGARAQEICPRMQPLGLIQRARVPSGAGPHQYMRNLEAKAELITAESAKCLQNIYGGNVRSDAMAGARAQKILSRKSIADQNDQYMRNLEAKAGLIQAQSAQRLQNIYGGNDAMAGARAQEICPRMQPQMARVPTGAGPDWLLIEEQQLQEKQTLLHQQAAEIEQKLQNETTQIQNEWEVLTRQLEDDREQLQCEQEQLEEMRREQAELDSFVALSAVGYMNNDATDADSTCEYPGF
uniref:uncharacterized protein n=1 Tax=Pristiophorus japonicus TaxID=55135 RepID=UPI00398E68E7